MPRPSVRAAGGVVWRPRKNHIEVALVHRPRYDDWSLPKGKLDDGETELDAGVREVEEELGARVAVGRRIGTVSYEVSTGQKSVTYWAMRYVGGEFGPGAEVDDVAWLRPKHAREQLSYAVDRRVLADFAALPTADSIIVLVRHAKAGKRSEWRGADVDRPLEPAGLAQAQRLVGLLSHFCPDRIVSAEPVRCVQTVEPLAEHLGLRVRVDSVFGDESFVRAPTATESALLALAKPERVTVVCSQGITIPALIDRLGRGVHASDTRKGAVWVLSVIDGNFVSMDYYPSE